jgi:hypothetical protein
MPAIRLRRRLVLVVAVAAAMALLGCGAQHVRPLAQTPSGSPTGSPAATVSVPPTASPTAGTTAEPLPAIKSVTGRSPLGVRVRLSVNELRRAEGGNVILVFTVRNDGAEDVSFGGSYAEKGYFDSGVYQSYDMSGVQLVDVKNRKRHLVLRDTGRRCICSGWLAADDVRPGKEAVLFAMFAAPPANVTAVNVVVPYFPVVKAVPIAS